MDEIVKDHLGNEYKSTAKMCITYGVPIKIYNQRINEEGLSIEEALTKIGEGTKRVADHLGKTYNSINSMCKAYGTNKKTYEKRLLEGLDPKTALTKKRASTAKPCEDHLGNKYPTILEMLDAYNIPPKVYYEYRKTMSFEEIVDKYKPLATVKDHLGKTYKSRKIMCDAYGVNHGTFLSRITEGMSLEKALTLPNQRIAQVIDHHGVKHDNEKEMSEAHNIPYGVYAHRKKRGWSLEQILTTPLKQPGPLDKTGETKRTRYGQLMTIVEYRNAQDMDVQFEDGYTVTVAYAQFSINSIRNPNLQTGDRRPRIAYELDDGTVALYYRCEKCGLSDVGTWQQIAEHQCNIDDVMNHQQIPECKTA